MKEKVRYSDFLLPMIIGVSLVLVISSFLYGLYIHFHYDTFPKSLTLGVLPLLVALGIGYFFIPKMRDRVFFKHILSRTNLDIHSMGLYLLLIVSSTTLFYPLALSIRYNVGKVIYLKNIDDMPAHEQPTFLELGEWYADRMRVIPINTYNRGKFFNRHQVYLKSMYLVPLFSRETAYQNNAKGWLAFKYEETMPLDEFLQNQGKPYFDQFVRHFKSIHVTAFLYFEQYPSGKERQLFTNMARIHSYFQRGYANIYEGRSVDRDLVSMRYFVYFLIIAVIFMLPSLWLISRFLLSPVKSINLYDFS